VDDLKARLGVLVAHPSSPPPPVDEIAARARRRRARRRAAVAVLVIAFGMSARTLVELNTDESAVVTSSPERPSAVESTTTGSTAASTTRSSTATSSTVQPSSTTSSTVLSTTTSTTASPPRSAVRPVLTSTVQDTDVGTSAGTVEYSGSSWTRCGGCDVATDDASYYYGYVAGDSYTVRFSGVQLKVYAPDDLNGGTALVTVDGRPAPVGAVSFMTTGTPRNGLRWDSGVLGDGDHTVVFTIQPGSSAVALFDRAEVYSDEDDA
jgi:hypothetical protein